MFAVKEARDLKDREVRFSGKGVAHVVPFLESTSGIWQDSYEELDYGSYCKFYIEEPSALNLFRRVCRRHDAVSGMDAEIFEQLTQQTLKAEQFHTVVVDYEYECNRYHYGDVRYGTPYDCLLPFEESHKMSVHFTLDDFFLEFSFNLNKEWEERRFDSLCEMLSRKDRLHECGFPISEKVLRSKSGDGKTNILRLVTRRGVDGPFEFEGFLFPEDSYLQFVEYFDTFFTARDPFLSIAMVGCNYQY